MSIHGTALDLSGDAAAKILGVNVVGAFLTAREGARRMLARTGSPKGFNRILLVSSIAGSRETLQTVTKLAPMYGASKAAIDMLGVMLAREWATQGINVNVIVPGHIQTEVNEEWTRSEGGKRRIGQFPRERMIGLNELSPLVLFLLSDLSSHITGSSFLLDDGQTL
jgi:NAD(P)-dependent dehydrogenase (short-subunit alcohol dehydrogenase family)